MTLTKIQLQRQEASIATCNEILKKLEEGKKSVSLRSTAFIIQDCMNVVEYIKHIVERAK